LDDDESERFAKEYSTQYQLITRDDRLDKIAEDIVNHYFYQD
jgi:type I restriction enzyme R subunit